MQACSQAQARAASDLRRPSPVGDQAPVGVARKDGARQLPPRPLLLAGQSRDTAPVPRAPGKARDEAEAGVAGGGTGGGTPEAWTANDRGHEGLWEGKKKQRVKSLLFFRLLPLQQVGFGFGKQRPSTSHVTTVCFLENTL